MKKFALSIISLALAASPVLASAHYDSTVAIDSNLHIVQRVADGSMDKDLRRVHSHVADQTLDPAADVITIDGTVRQLEVSSYQHATDVMSFICASVVTQQGGDASVCGVRTQGHTRIGW